MITILVELEGESWKIDVGSSWESSIIILLVELEGESWKIMEG